LPKKTNEQFRFLGKQAYLNVFLHFFFAKKPIFRYISAHEIRSKHQLLVVAGPINGAWYFWYGFQKKQAPQREPIFLQKFWKPGKEPETDANYNKERKIK